MPWVRRRYRGNKVWIETDEGGEHVLDERGLARLRYKPTDDRTYSVRPTEVLPVEATEGGAADESPTPKPRARKGAAARPRGATSAAAHDAPAPTEDGETPGDDVRALAGLEVHVWTDGAASGNPGPAGSGYVLLFREHRKEASIWLGDATNNVAELTAVLEALRNLKREDVPVRVHSDSSYVIGVVSGAMRAKANRDLVDEIRAQVARFADLRFVKVAAHTGVEWNERADALAREAIRARASRTVSLRT